MPNETLCADDELVRVGFMHPTDVRQFILQMRAQGLRYLLDGYATDMVVADQMRGLAAPCDWASFGHIDWNGDPKQRVVRCCLLKDSAQKTFITPEGWSYEASLTSSFGFVPSGAEHTLRPLGEEDGLESYRSPLSEKTVYVGQTSREEEGWRDG